MEIRCNKDVKKDTCDSKEGRGESWEEGSERKNLKK